MTSVNTPTRGRRRILLGLCAWCCLCPLGWAAKIGSESGEDGAGREASLRQSLDEFLEVLERHALLPENSEENRLAAFKALLESFKVPGGLSEPVVPGAASPAAGPADVIRRVDTVGGLFVRVWVDRVGAGLGDALRDALGDVGHGHYEGIVLDLRDAGGEALDEVSGCVGFLKDLGLPTVALINGATTGASECLCAFLRDELGVITLGQPTRGVPFDTFVAELSTGETMRLPKAESQKPVTEKRPAWAPAPIQPDVSADGTVPVQSPGPDRDGVWQQDPVEGDGCLRRAVDLLIAVRALGG